MIPKDCKRLAEVDFPIAVVSKHAAREKSIRHGHPSTLHLWWARRPLAACRAMLMALLLPDPCDEHCPGDFKEKARALLPQVTGTIGPKDEDLRRAILKFIGDFANWDRSADATFLEVARGLVKAAHGEEPPLVVDPFAGGGSIPLEALRIGCDAFASDLNPVACLILKIMLEDIPRHGPELADELRRVGAEIKAKAEKELAEFYPPDPDGARPIAYLWARTVRCESPNCGAGIPLVRSFWLCKKANRTRGLRYKVVRPSGAVPRVEFEVFEPKSEKEVPAGTVTRAKAACPCCNTVLSPERVRAQLNAQRGGADVIFDGKGNRTGGAYLLAVVTLRPGEQGRHYRLPTNCDYQTIWKTQEHLQEILNEWEEDGRQGYCPVPDEPLPPIGTLGFRVQRYGMLQWSDLFTSRQKMALLSICDAMESSSETRYVSSARTLCALATTRFLDDFSSLVRWMDRETPAATFTRQALPILWDFCETYPFDNVSWSFQGSLEWVATAIEGINGLRSGQVQQADATESPLPDAAASIWFTDPPYYDAIPYSDLSDYFLVWLKRMLPGHPLLQDPYDPSNMLSPKDREAVQDGSRLVNGRPKDRIFFENAMARAFAESRSVLKEEGVGSVVFAHKTTEGWEALLTGIIRGGWVITGSWPIATERKGRPRSHDSAVLATSVHLVCRPRPDDAPVGDWAAVLGELPRRVGDWMERLQNEGVRGADLVFACIGPALEIFSRYSRVETADGKVVGLPYFLERVWEEIGRAALRQVLGTDAPTEIEEDARLVALFLWTLRSGNGGDFRSGSEAQDFDDDSSDWSEDEEASGPHAHHPSRTQSGYALPYDIARRFCQPLGIHLDRWEGRLIETQKGIVRLLPLAERARKILGDEVSQDLAWLNLPHSKSRAGQLKLFESSPSELSKSKEEREASARRRVEAETWAHLHRDSITLLDHVHKALIFQKQGKTSSLRELLFYEKSYRPEFLRLANALSALYPKGSEEKRLLDAMLLAVPR